MIAVCCPMTTYNLYNFFSSVLQGESFVDGNVAVIAASTLSCCQHDVTMFLVLRVWVICSKGCVHRSFPNSEFGANCCFRPLAKARSFSFSNFLTYVMMSM